MGAGYHGGFGKTKGAKNNETNKLIKDLESNGVKFSKEDIVFITKDKTGQTVWLEKGNSSVGLEHSINGNRRTPGHAKDFEKTFGISKAEIPNYLNKVISNGSVISSGLKNINGRSGFERIYYFDKKYYVLTDIGTNGFIVTAYPIELVNDNFLGYINTVDIFISKLLCIR